MAEFLTTHATAYHIENIILNAKEKLVLVSPYLQVSRNFLDRLKDADERGTEILVIYGKDELKPEERDQLNKLKNLSLFFCENVHAKCYFNQDNMVITSMNMYEFSEKTNREMGVLISSVEDVHVYKDAVREIQSIVRASIKKEDKTPEQPQPSDSRITQKPSILINKGGVPIAQQTTIPKTNIWNQDVKKLLRSVLSTVFAGDKLDAYCIRCGNRLPFDTSHPLCDECYGEWAQYQNPEYSEHFCHLCGKREKTTKARPLCSSCYSKSKN